MAGSGPASFMHVLPSLPTWCENSQHDASVGLAPVGQVHRAKLRGIAKRDGAFSDASAVFAR